ncbi:MAG TPA: helix-turn-helix domain-containing protein [Mycobacteriales bacterium]|jgi:predicted ArsR family transcriptional regulator|nr:helix-turn-helix domain-containing protein [Mycobacteriales bacterium]
MDDKSLDAVGLLADPVRRRLYAYVAEQGGPVGRANAAAAVHITRPLAAFHLDKLAGAGLLEVDYQRPPGRGGPGAGRPAKVYRVARTERAVSLPPRSYDLVAGLLADTVARVGAEDDLAAAAAAAGRADARHVPNGKRAVAAFLTARGYQPYADGATLRLRNCPFHQLATDHPPMICAMNLALLDNLLDGWDAALDPRPGECCVALRRRSKTNPD